MSQAMLGYKLGYILDRIKPLHFMTIIVSRYKVSSNPLLPKYPKPMNASAPKKLYSK